MKARISALCGLLLCAISFNVKAQQEPQSPAPVATSNQTAPPNPTTNPNSSTNANPATVAAPSVEPEPATIVSVAPEKREEPEIIGGETSDNSNTLASNTGASSISNSSAPIQASVMRARSLAALGNFAGATQILEPLRASAADSATANVARLLLTSIYLEQAEYKKAQTLLGEAFNGRTANEATMRAYYTVAGQLLNGVRARLNHYRAYNVDITISTLPVEINNDLDGIRNLLDSLIAQASTLQSDGKSTNSDAAALFEDASGVRMNLARTRNERDEWERRVADARQRLVAADVRMQIDNVPTAAETNVNNFASLRRKNRKESLIKKEVVVKPETSSTETATATAATTAALNNEVVAPTANANSISSSTPSSVIAAPTTPNAASPTVNNAANLTVEVGALATKATQRVQPVYPSTARAARVGGIVTVYLTLNEQGRVENVRSTTGPELLRRAAEDAARRWRFRQTLVNQQAVRVSGYISFNFAL